MSTRPTSAANRARAAKLWRGGSTYREIASELGVTPGAVAQWLRLAREADPSLPRRRPLPWSPQEDELLVAAIARGDDIEACARDLGRPTQATARRVGRLRGLGLLPTFHEPWSATQDEVVVGSFRSGQPVREISNAVARPHHQVNTRISTLRTNGADLPPRKPRWTDEDRGRLARLYREGTSLKQLEHEFGKTRGHYIAATHVETPWVRPATGTRA